MRNVHISGSQSDHLDWFRQGVLYQIFPDRFAREENGKERELENWSNLPTRENFFGGNFRGIQAKIEYFTELAIENIYFTPIFKAPANHRYDTSDYLELDPLLGNEEDFRSLVQELRKSNIGIILDAVFNHCGEEFPPFQKAMQGDPISRKWFQFDGPINEYQTVGGAQMMPQLNTGNEEVVEYFKKVMEKWDSFGIRGWRLDVPWKTETGFFDQLKQDLKPLASNRLWIAEAWWLWNLMQYSESIMNYHARNRILDFVHRHHADAEDFIIDLLQWTSQWEDPSLILNIIGSHDTPRLLTMCDGDKVDALFSIALNMLIPGVPMLYYGDEIALPGENDPDCRRTFPKTMNSDEIQFLGKVKKFTNLRADHKSLSHGCFDSIHLRNHALVFQRSHGDCQIYMAINTNNRVEAFKTSLDLDWDVIEGKVWNQNGIVELHPKSLAIFVKKCKC
jgi:cyclomaltodextrinase